MFQENLALEDPSAYNNPMSEQPDILIVGGGVIGLSTAYFLAREGVRVEVVDKGDFGQEASWAGAGILPPGNPARAATPLDQLRGHSAALFPGLSAELRDKTGIDNGYLRCGGLDFNADGNDPVEDAWEAEGIVHECLEEKSYRRLEPALAVGLGKAYHLPDLAQVRNPRHVRALLAGCEALGVHFRAGCPVHGFDVAGDRVRAVRTSAGALAAGRFLLTTGAWTDALLDELGWRPGIRPVRGQIALLNTGRLLIHRVLMSEKRYLVPRGDGRVLAGSTEEEAGFDKRTTAGAIRDLLDFAFGLVPGLADVPLERSWAGLRPAGKDGLPYIGPVPTCENVWLAAGHFRAGIQLSPATALVLTETLLGKEPAVSLEPFRLDRQPAPPRRVAFRS